jgi:hypothetical protein
VRPPLTELTADQSARLGSLISSLDAKASAA